MRIKKLHIQNYKSLVDFELFDLKPFCAFVGPNASGKSNIFEALEFTNYLIRYSNEAARFFGGVQAIYTFSRPNVNIDKSRDISFHFDYEFEDGININFHPRLDKQTLNQIDVITSYGLKGKGLETWSCFNIKNLNKRKEFIETWLQLGNAYEGDFEQFYDGFFRVFVGKTSLNRTPPLEGRISPDASNVAQIIGNAFGNEETRNDFIEWLRILIPEFKSIEVRKSNIDGSYDFFVYEKGSEKPFSRSLISDGTYNILSLMAAVYQSAQPQFICIEEPENGLHPQAIELLIDFFREKCEERGHHIWLNTHSQTLVRCMEIDEIILINKIDGATRAKQLTKDDEIDIKTDEAWLSNALGGGVLWSK